MRSGGTEKGHALLSAVVLGLRDAGFPKLAESERLTLYRVPPS